MKSIRIKKGHGLKVSGAPSLATASLPAPDRVGMAPVRIPFIKPRLKVREGDHVLIGSEILEDKHNPAVKFVAPGAGLVEKIQFGRRRVIEALVIRLDKEESFKEFKSFNAADLASESQEGLVEALLQGGVWPFFRELPFRKIPDPKTLPPGIIVGVSALEPFQPRPEMYLQGKQDLFQFGIDALKRLSSKVLVSVHADDSKMLDDYTDMITHKVSGPYPADDPGVLCYHTKSVAEENKTWFINGQDLIRLAEFLATGRYPIERIMVLGGSAAKNPTHFKTRQGISCVHLAGGMPAVGDVRYVTGGIFTGSKVPGDSYMGFYETGLNVIPDGQERDFLNLIDPGYRKASYSRAFLSHFNKDEFEINGHVHGGLRACITCGYCMEVCPVDIIPHLAYKAILVDEVEEALAHGILDCVECGLCSYVCPAKIELFQTIKQAKADYHKEQMQQ